MNIKDSIVSLTRRLYPKGRAFNFLPDGWVKAIHRGLAHSESLAYQDALSVINDSLLPDNLNFTEEDASIWEERLAIPVSQGATLEERKEAILRKWRHPGNAKARAHRLFIEGQLQEAGFDVYVYENRINDGMGGITTVNPNGYNGHQHGEFEHGEFEHGEFSTEILANYIDIERDLDFDFNGDYSTVFFIASDQFGTVDSEGVVSLNTSASAGQRSADVSLVRRDEFRELLLRLKPAKTIGFLLINWT